MSNYTLITSFVSKDSLISGNPLKAVKGAEMTTEFTAVQTALNSKIDGVVQFFTDGTAGQPSVGFTNNAGTGMYNAAGVLNFATNSLQRISVAVGGNVTVNAPASGTALTITNFAGSPGISVVGAGTVPLQIQELTAQPTSQLGGYVGIGTSAVAGGTGINGDLFLIPRTTQACAVNIATGNGTAAVRLQVNGTGNVTINAPTSGNALTVAAVSGTHSTKIADSANASFNAGFLEAPFHAVSGSYTPILSDNGKTLDCASGTAITLPLNASVAYPIGAVITILADFGAGSMTVAGGAGDTLFLAGNIGTTGTRTLAPLGLATVMRISTTQWVIAGSGVT